MDQKAIVQFYDAFVETQMQAGVNDRVYGLFKRLKNLGLQRGSNVLELGCGIGTMTFLLSRYVKDGKIEAVDISPASIKFASNKVKKDNVKFVVADTVRYLPTMKDIDIITLFDIIEHIPAEQHEALFKNIASYSIAETIIVINIPSPASVEYDRQHHPATLQVIDQPVPLGQLLNAIENAGLNLLHFETYSIWVKHDYQFLIVSKSAAYDGVLLQDKKGLLQKAFGKFQREWRKLIYRYS